MMPETRNVEWMRSCRDEIPLVDLRLREREGGICEIGKDDYGNIVGVRRRLGPGTRRRAPRLQRAIVQPLRQRPGEARRGRPARVLAYRAVGDAERRGDLAMAAPELVVQAQKFSNLPHGQPWL